MPPDTDLPRVAVIIAHLNGRDLLPACLGSLFRQNYPNYEVTVVDNGSTDGSVEFVRRSYPQVKIVQNRTNLGYAGANNVGAERSDGELLLFLNHDTVVSEDFLIELVNVLLQDPSVGIVQSKMLMAKNPGLIDSVGSYFTRTGILVHKDRALPDSCAPAIPVEVFGATGACLLVRRQLFEALRGFDSDYVIYYEDTDLSWRTWLLGYKVLLVPSSVIWHWGGATTSRYLPSPFTIFHTFKNRLCSLIKLLPSSELVLVLPLHLLICLGGAAAYLIHLKLTSGWAILKALLWNFQHVGETMTKRKEIGDLATVPRGSLFPRLQRPMPADYFMAVSRGYLSSW